MNSNNTKPILFTYLILTSEFLIYLFFKQIENSQLFVCKNTSIKKKIAIKKYKLDYFEIKDTQSSLQGKEKKIQKFIKNESLKIHAPNEFPLPLIT